MYKDCQLISTTDSKVVLCARPDYLKILIIAMLVVMFFGCELNPYIDRECEVRALAIVEGDHILQATWEQRGSLPTHESFTITQVYYESLTVGDIIIYSDILENVQ